MTEITVLPPRLPSQQLVATNAADMLSCEQSVVDFFRGQMRDAEEELAEDERQLAAAQKAGLCVRAIKRHLALARQKIQFFEKAVVASDAGFHVFPYLPDSDPFAIRVDGGVGAWGRRDSYKHRTDVPFYRAPRLAFGEGEYVSAVPGVTRVWDDRWSRRQKFDKESREWVFDGWEAGYTYYASSWKAPEVPELIRNSAIIECIHHAMDLRVFDELRVCPGANEKMDPVVFGTILDYRRHRSHRPLTFLLAWYLDLRTL